MLVFSLDSYSLTIMKAGQTISFCVLLLSSKLQLAVLKAAPLRVLQFFIINTDVIMMLH